MPTYFPEGPGMVLPYPAMVWRQDVHPQMVQMENQGVCMQNPQLPGSHAPFNPYMMACPPQQVGNPPEGAWQQNPPQELYNEEPAVGSFMQLLMDET